MIHVLYSIPGPLGATGIGTTAWHEVDALARAGARVSVVCTRLDRRFDPGLPIDVVSTLGPIRPRLVGVHNAYRYHDAVTARLVTRRRPQVVHTWPGAVLRTAAVAHHVGALVVRAAPSPYTRVAATQAATAWAEIGLNPPKGHFHALPESRLAAEDVEFQAVDAVLVGSRQAAETFTAAAFPVHRVVSPYGYDETRYRVGAPAHDQLTVAFIGRPEPTKGIHVLLRAWRRAERPESARLLLCGPPMASLVRDRLREELGDSTIQERGFVTDVAGVLRESDVLVLPSFSEGSALVGYEAWGAGCVPLVSDATGCPVRDGVDGLVHRAGDVSTLATQLGEVLSDPVHRARLHEGVLAVRKEWTWLKAGPRLLACYADLASVTHC